MAQRLARCSRGTTNRPLHRKRRSGQQLPPSARLRRHKVCALETVATAHISTRLTPPWVARRRELPQRCGEANVRSDNRSAESGQSALGLFLSFAAREAQHALRRTSLGFGSRRTRGRLICPPSASLPPWQRTRSAPKQECINDADATALEHGRLMEASGLVWNARRRVEVVAE